VSAALEIKGLEAGYGPLSVLHGVDLSIAEGERVGILGLNGHGKTTMLRAIVDLVDWKRGDILLNGEDITHATTHALARRGVVLMPQGDALMLVMMRYPQELVDVDDYNIPAGATGDYRVNAKELQMAQALIDSMAGEWAPGNYQDEFRARLHKVIEKRVKAKGGTVPRPDDDGDGMHEDASTNVVDFMSLLQQSIDSRKRTPAAKSGGKAAKKATSKLAKKTTKKAPVKKAAKRKSA